MTGVTGASRSPLRQCGTNPVEGALQISLLRRSVCAESGVSSITRMPRANALTVSVQAVCSLLSALV